MRQSSSETGSGGTGSSEVGSGRTGSGHRGSSGMSTNEASRGQAGHVGLVVADASVDYDGVGYDDGRAPQGQGRKGKAQRLVACADVNLTVGGAEIVALLGPSGCGKSSLLRAIAGLEPLAAGTVHFDGQDMSGIPTHRRAFGLLFQDGQLFPHRDVARNIAYGLEVAKVPRDQRQLRVEELLDLVGLTGFDHRRIATLSGGERQRVALARALAPRPRLMLLDEPFSALDRNLRERLAADVRSILKASGTPAICVTHDHGEAFAVADTVAVMLPAQPAQSAQPQKPGQAGQAGTIVQTASPQVLRSHPASPQVAAFLGLPSLP